MEKPTYKFKTNIPVSVHFISDKPQIGIGQYGEWYKYDVVVYDLEQVIFAPKGLHERLERLEKLSGRTLEIMKTEGERGSIFWKIKENGIDITPEVHVTRQTNEHPLEEDNLTELSPLEERIKILENRLNKASQFFKNLNQRVERTEDEMKHIREEVRPKEKEMNK